MGRQVSDYDAAFAAAVSGPAKDDPYDAIMRDIAPKATPASPAASEVVSQKTPDNDFWGLAKNALNTARQATVDAGLGAVRGAGSIGASLLAPVDVAKDALAGKGLSLESNRSRRAEMDDALRSMGADPDSWMYKGGKLAGEIAGTAGMGGVLAKPVQALAASRYGAGIEPLLEGAAQALQTGGFRVGDMAGTGMGALARALGGGATGGASAGLVNPGDAGAGALIGGALPGGLQALKVAGDVAAKGVRGAVGEAVPEVQKLAQRAKELGITIPADRLIDSRPLNAMAASLNYVPMSGRAATEDAMNSQLNRALSRTFGQDSSNVTQALRKADTQLGGAFEKTLSENGVKFDKQFLDDIAAVHNKAEAELGAEGLKPITNKVNELISKGETGVIDGQAAYNIKRDLDRLGKANTPNAWHALELKHRLMDALNRSLGPDKAAEFATVRQHYGNMLDLEKLAKNGAEGEVSVARVANMKNIGNKPLQEIADIAAQFVKPREGQHGAAQRVFGAGGASLAALAAGLGLPLGIPAAIGAAGVMGIGRVANSALNSGAARRTLMGPLGSAPAAPGPLGIVGNSAYRTAPLLLDQD